MSTQTKRVGRPRKDPQRGEGVSLLNIPKRIEQQCIERGALIETVIPQLLENGTTQGYAEMSAARERWQGEERRKIRVDRQCVRRMIYLSDGHASWLAVCLLERWLAQGQ